MERFHQIIFYQQAVIHIKKLKIIILKVFLASKFSAISDSIELEERAIGSSIKLLSASSKNRSRWW
jgi:predicted metal-dependent hydrolase